MTFSDNPQGENPYDHQANEASRSNLSKLLRWVFLALACIAAFALITSEWDDIQIALATAKPIPLIIALLASFGFAILSYIGWRILLTKTSAPRFERALVSAFFLGQIGKYLPGGIWPILMTAQFGTQAGLKQRTIASTMLLAMIINLLAGISLALALVPGHIDWSWLDADLGTISLVLISVCVLAFAALIITLVMSPAVRSQISHHISVDFIPSPTKLALSTLAGLAVWGFGGVQLAMLASAFGMEFSWASLAYYTGSYALAWVAGFLILLSPAGAGVREAVLIGMLTITMGLAHATLIALLSRAMFTLVDFGLAGIAAYFNHRQAA